MAKQLKWCVQCNDWLFVCPHSDEELLPALQTEMRICHSILTDAGIPTGGQLHERIAMLVVSKSLQEEENNL